MDETTAPDDDEASTGAEARDDADRWRYALQSVEDGLWDWRSDTGRVYRSDRCLGMLGLAPGDIHEDVPGWQALVHPEDRLRQQSAIARHLSGESPSYRIEYRARHADGSWRWILDRGRVMTRDAEGRPTRVVGIHTDITDYKRLENRLRERELLLEEALQVGQIGSWAWDPVNDDVWWSSELHRIVGIPESQGAPSWAEQAAIYTPESLARLSALVRRTLEHGGRFNTEVTMLRPDGEARTVEVAGDSVHAASGKVTRLVGVVRDLTDEKRATEAARWRSKLLDRIASMGRIGGFELVFDTRTFQWTDENYRIHGIAPGTVVTVESLMPHYDIPSRLKLQAALRRMQSGESEEETTEVDYTTPDGRHIVLRLVGTLEYQDGKPWKIAGLSQDITEEREAGKRIELLAHFDSLTGLPNRLQFRQHAADAIRVAQRAKLNLALLFIDLDRFKYVNDTLGHASGDVLLQEVGSRLKACLRGSDLIGRQGGDEFMVMLCELRRVEDAAAVAEKIIAAVGQPIHLGEQEVRVGCSIGIALLSEAYADLDSLMRASDTAMYAAKERGRNTFEFYNDSFYARVQRRGLLEQELRQAVSRNELFLEYQPTVSLDSGETMGIEALLRWRRPDGELRSPMEFIPIAEETGEINGIGLWVLETACAQAAAWDARGLRFRSIAVNVSAVQLRDPGFGQRVLDVCKQCGWPPSRLVLELTESALMHDNEVLRRSFRVFESSGIRLAVDDFGTGFSNLTYLHRFPVRHLKIDRSFVSQMLIDLQVGVLTQAIISLGHAMGLIVIAEGVEDGKVLRALRSQGCDEAQGYHLTRPLGAEALVAWLEARADGTGAPAST